MSVSWHHVPSRVWKCLKKVFEPNPNRWLKEAHRLLHIGANEGPEIPLYAKLGLEVLWFEALPEVFERLQTNLRGQAKQSAVQALLTDQEGKKHVFHVANNDGAASSLFELKEVVQLWPEVRYVKQVELSSQRLDSLLFDRGYEPGYFDSAVLDVQGAELLVLQGTGVFLEGLQRVCCEAADFEAYEGACNLTNLSEFMFQHGFRIRQKHRFHHARGVGAYYDVLYVRG